MSTKKRISPNEHASDLLEGTVLKGNDDKKWIVIIKSDKTHQWVHYTKEIEEKIKKYEYKSYQPTGDRFKISFMEIININDYPQNIGKIFYVNRHI